jgi:hypothetical protein
LLEPHERSAADGLERDLDVGRHALGPGDLCPRHREAPTRLPARDAADFEFLACFEVVDLDEASADIWLDPHREAAVGVVPVGRAAPPPDPDLLRLCRAASYADAAVALQALRP